jgi:uncharacterized surface protein with fasciclin (FAS1) repeats
MFRKSTPWVTSLAFVAVLAATPALSKEKKSKKADAEMAQPATPPADDMAAPDTTSTAPSSSSSEVMGPPGPAGSSAPQPASAAPAPDATMISSDKTVVENASNSPDFTTLVKAVKSAGLAETLSGAGPFTIFAPSNAGFDRLPPGTVEALLKPENQGSLSKILNYHVVAGKVTAADLAQKIKAGKGKALVTSLSGDTLTAIAEGQSIKLIDGNGNASAVTKADIAGSNGVIHSINGVLIPSDKTPAPPAR